jgi:hypothetical protein
MSAADFESRTIPASARIAQLFGFEIGIACMSAMAPAQTPAVFSIAPIVCSEPLLPL